MKVVVVICAIVLLLQAIAIGFNVRSGTGEPPSEDEIKGGWNAAEQFPIAATFERLLEPVRPRLELPWEEKTFAPGAEERVPFENGSNDSRVAKFELTAGTGLRIRYDCRDDDKCEQVVCLCQANQPVALQDFQEPCGDAFRPQNGRCPADGNTGEIIVHSETGTIGITGLGAAGGTVRQR